MLITRGRSWKPVPGTPVLRAGLGLGLAGLWPFWEGAGAPAEALTGVRATAHGGVSWSATRHGPGLSFGGSSGYLGLGVPSSGDGVGLNVNGPCSFACLAAPAANEANQHWLDVRTAGGLGFFLAFNGNGNNELTLFQTSWIQSAAGVVDGGWHAWGVTWSSGSAGGLQFYRDGRPIGTGAASFVDFAAATTIPVVGANTGGTGAFLSGGLALLACWRRPLSAADHAAFASDPWQLFRPRESWVSRPPGGVVPADGPAAGDRREVGDPGAAAAGGRGRGRGDGVGLGRRLGGASVSPASATMGAAAVPLLFSAASPGTYAVTVTSSSGAPVIGSPLSVVVEAGASRRRPVRSAGFVRRHEAFGGGK